MKGPQAISVQKNAKKCSKTYRKAFEVSTNFYIKCWRHEDFHELLLSICYDLKLSNVNKIRLELRRCLDMSEH